MNPRSAALLVVFGVIASLCINLYFIVRSFLGLQPIFESQASQLTIYMIRLVVSNLPLIIFFFVLYARQKENAREGTDNSFA